MEKFVTQKCLQKEVVSQLKAMKSKTSDNLVVRVAVGRPEGPYSAAFRIWSPPGKSDVYASVRDIAGDIKISLHESGECFAGLTSQFAKKETAAVTMIGGLRHQSQWTRLTHVGSRMVCPLQFAIPASELKTWRSTPLLTKDVTWLESPGQERSVIISCIFTGQCLEDGNWPGRQNGTQILATKLLPNSEKFWLIYQNCPTSTLERTILTEAQTHKRQQEMVCFSEITENTPPAPRNLVFKELFDDQLLVVLDAAAL